MTVVSILTLVLYTLPFPICCYLGWEIKGTLESEIFSRNTYKEDKTQCIPCEFGSGKFSLGTRCMTVVFPVAKPNADSVTLQWRKRP